MSERFAARFVKTNLQVTSELQGAFENVARLLEPAINIRSGTISDREWLLRVKLTTGAARDRYMQRTPCNAPRLIVAKDELEYDIFRTSWGATTIVTSPIPKIGWHALHCDLPRRTWTLHLDNNGLNGFRWIAKIILRYLGTIAQWMGLQPMHGSAVAVDGSGVLYVGSEGSGKSSLMYLSCARIGAAFCSDDMVFIDVDSDGRLVAHGWPKRVALGQGLLQSASPLVINEIQRFGLRKPPILGTGDYTSRERRVRFDLDEFLRLFRFPTVRSVVPRVVVVPKFRAEMHGFNIEALSGREAKAVIRRNSRNFSELPYITDFLRMVPEPPPVQKRVTADDWGRIRCVRVTFGPDIGARFVDLWGRLQRLAGPCESATGCRVEDK